MFGRLLKFPLRDVSRTAKLRLDIFRRFEGSWYLLSQGIHEAFLLDYDPGYEGIKILRNVGHGETPQATRIGSDWRFATTATKKKHLCDEAREKIFKCNWHQNCSSLRDQKQWFMFRSQLVMVSKITNYPDILTATAWLRPNWI
jgi:hypothetical protein